MQTANDNPRVLLRITNLKQYFPLKRRGLYVRANDGITLDIYEGETLGLVGESGCGKSTLGRTLLQLYRQTDGRTMYYGRTLDDLAPKYVGQTLATLDKRRAQLKTLRERRDAVRREYDALPDGKAKYAKYNDLTRAEKEANDAFLDMANLIGGFINAPDLKPVSEAFLKVYRISSRLCAAERKLEDLRLAFDDADFAAAEAVRAGKNPAAQRARADKRKAAVRAQEKAIEDLRAQVAQARGEIERMREQYRDDPEFQRLEAFRDEGVDLARLRYDEIPRLRRDLQMIFQDPYSSLNPRMTVGQIVGEGMRAHKFFKRNDKRMQDEILRVMDEAGLASYFLHRYPHQFSGGQRQRIGIARSLAVRPKFVVCDEAVSALDVSIQSQIINLLRDLKEQQHLTYLFITHDLSVVKYISDRIGVMYLGNLVELAPAQELFDHPRHPYTEALMAAIPTTDVDNPREMRILEGDIPSPVNPPAGCKFHTRCRYCTEICEHAVPDWTQVGPNHFVACHHMLGAQDEAKAGD